MCATPTAHFLEYADWWNPVIAEPLRIEHGMALALETTGTGVAWNEQAVDRFAA
jgi:mandelate racemase